MAQADESWRSEDFAVPIGTEAEPVDPWGESNAGVAVHVAPAKASGTTSLIVPVTSVASTATATPNVGPVWIEAAASSPDAVEVESSSEPPRSIVPDAAEAPETTPAKPGHRPAAGFPSWLQRDIFDEIDFNAASAPPTRQRDLFERPDASSDQDSEDQIPTETVDDGDEPDEALEPDQDPAVDDELFAPTIPSLGAEEESWIDGDTAALENDVPGVELEGPWIDDGRTLDADWEEAAAWADPTGWNDSSVTSWRDDVQLPDFDPEASRNPWANIESDVDVGLRRPRGKAAAVIDHFDIRSAAKREEALAFLVSLFTEYPAGSSFSAILALAEDGIDLETLRAAASLRAHWSDQTRWRVRRVRGEFVSVPRAQSPLPWRLACRLCSLRSDYEVEDVIDPDWFDEWAELTPGDEGYPAFVEYIRLKVSDAESSVFAGARRFGRDLPESELADDYDWQHHALDHHGALTGIPAIKNPFDHRLRATVPDPSAQDAGDPS